MARYKQKCWRCRKNYALVLSPRQRTECVQCGMKAVDKEIVDDEYKKLLDIDRSYYEESSFLRSIRENYHRYGALSERQREIFGKVLEELKNPELRRHKTVYLLRHGESTSNAAEVLPTPEARLTEKGMKQAFAMAAFLRDKGVQALYCSTLERAVATANVISEAMQLKPMRKAALKDTNAGRFAGQPVSDKETRDAIRLHRTDIEGKRPQGIETFAAVQRRVKPFAEKLMASRARTIAVVSHLDVTRVLLAELMDGKMTEYAKAKQPNDCVYIVDTAGKAVRNWRSGKEAEGLLQ